MRSWAAQRDLIRRAAGAGARPRASAVGAQLLPLHSDAGEAQRGADPSRPVLLRAHQPAASQPPAGPAAAPHLRGAPATTCCSAAARKSWSAPSSPTGTTTSPGWGRLFSRRSSPITWPTHVRWSFAARGGRAALPGTPTSATTLNAGLSRQSDALSPQQVERNVKAGGSGTAGEPCAGRAPHGAERGEVLTGRIPPLAAELPDHPDRGRPGKDRDAAQTAPGVLFGGDVSFQLHNGSEVLCMAFEARQDRLCVPRQLAHLLELGPGQGHQRLRRDLRRLRGGGRRA